MERTITVRGVGNISAKPDFIVPQNVSPLDATMQSIVDRAMKLNPKNTDRNIEEK